MVKNLTLPPAFPFPAMRTELADGDTMHDGRDDHYLAVGLSALGCIERALAGRTPRTILDLPCGFGRVTRVLQARFPAARITASDLDRPGVDFTARQFEARPVYSVDDLGQLRLGESYDLIWVGSLVTHLSEAQTRAFLASMAASLAPDGVLVVSSHGGSIAPGLKSWGYGLEPAAVIGLLDDYRVAGYGHRGYGNSTGYGISLTDQAWWEQAAPAAGLDLLSYVEQEWDAHQDIVSLRRPGRLQRLLRNRRPPEPPAVSPAVAAARATTAAYDTVLARFDPAHYLATYPDVAAAVQAGSFTSAYHHYHDYGHREGRSIRQA